MSNIVKSVAAAALVLGLTVSSYAEAGIVISQNGVVKASDPTNTFAVYDGSATGFNVINISGAGVNSFADGTDLLDVGSLAVSMTGAGTVTLKVTETDLSVGAGATFLGTFSGLISHASVSRAFYLDTTDSGLTTTLLGSTTAADGSFTFTTPLSGPFSITEVLSVTATGRGARLSADDSLSVPEPASTAVLAASFLGLGFIRRRQGK